MKFQGQAAKNPLLEGIREKIGCWRKTENRGFLAPCFGGHFSTLGSNLTTKSRLGVLTALGLTTTYIF